MKKWEIQQSREIFKGRIFTLNDNLCHHPEKDVEHNFYVLDTYNWINVVALTKDNKFIMVQQHRLGTDTITLETAGGLIENNEPASECALRELREETGYSTPRLILLKKLAANPAILNNYIYFFLATDCEHEGEQQLDSAEDIEIKTFTYDEVINLIRTGEIDHSIVVTALSLYFMSEHTIFPHVIL